ncbi:MAG: CPBP family intramembrane metalloprotease [Caldilineaceae bacterium]|nr:CPBP family intramembrane metalloprotease [Caldilineaceae bacterium]
MHPLLWLFWNRVERRLRAGWRVFIHLICYLYAPPLLNAAIGEPISLALARALPELAPLSDRLTLFGLRLVAVLLSTWLVVRFIDHRPWSEIGLQFDRSWWVDLLFGLFLGALLMTFVFVVEYSAGWVEIRDIFVVDLNATPFVVALIGPVVVSLVISIIEELLARGYQLRNLAEGLNLPNVRPVVAVVASWAISSSLFGLLHVFNPNATWLSTLYLMLTGVFFGLGYVLTGRLGLPIGLHFAWNFFQGNIYGFPVSGNIFGGATVIEIQQGGPPLWTGGAFGPEAGLLGIAAILLGCLLTLLWVKARYQKVAFYLPLACYNPPNSPSSPPLAEA